MVVCNLNKNLHKYSWKWWCYRLAVQGLKQNNYWHPYKAASSIIQCNCCCCNKKTL